MCQFSLEQVSGSFGPKIKSFWEGGSFRPKSLGLGREMKSGVRSSVDPALEGALLVDSHPPTRLPRYAVMQRFGDALSVDLKPIKGEEAERALERCMLAFWEMPGIFCIICEYLWIWNNAWRWLGRYKYYFWHTNLFLIPYSFCLRRLEYLQCLAKGEIFTRSLKGVSSKRPWKVDFAQRFWSVLVKTCTLFWENWCKFGKIGNFSGRDRDVVMWWLYSRRWE